MASDWDQRQLCPDGGCVGVIGPDGTCMTCGRAAPNWGDERRRGQRTTAEVDPAAVPEQDDPDGEEEGTEDGDDDEYEDDDDGDGDEDEDEDVVVEDRRSPDEVIAAGDGPADFEARALCPDGACIGVIGDNGRCRVCGRKAE